MISNLAQFCDVDIAMAVGGIPIKQQEHQLMNYPEIIIATPGRLIDHLKYTKSIEIGNLKALVLDEADRLLKLGLFFI